MDERKDTAVEAVLEHLIEHGPGDIATVFSRAFELAMRIERERFLGAGLYERTAARQGYANGYKPKRIDTPAARSRCRFPRAAAARRRSIRNLWNGVDGPPAPSCSPSLRCTFRAFPPATWKR